MAPNHPKTPRRVEDIDILGANMPYSYKNPSGTSSGALGRRVFVRPEFIAMLNEAGGPRCGVSISNMSRVG